MDGKVNHQNILKEIKFNMSISIFVLLVFCGTLTAGCQRGELLKRGVTELEKKQILVEHNRLRQNVAQGRISGQPAAENMQEMQWDNELAVKAQQWAEECVFKHDPSRYLGRFTMGQNLALIWSTIPLAEDDGDFPSRIKNWFDEVQKYAFGSNWSLKTGHYSQLVWGDTNLIGCGFSYYHEGAKYNKLYVCNYGPGGNVIGSNPYATGRPSCHNYGMNPSQKYPGLCKTEPDYGSNNDNNEFELENNISPPDVPYFTYKSYNSQFDTQKKVGTSTSTRNDVQATINNKIQGISSNFNNLSNLFKPYSVGNYITNKNTNLATSPKPPPTQKFSFIQQPFQRPLSAFQKLQQTDFFNQPHMKSSIKFPIITGPVDPFKTYRWDLLFN